MKDTQILISCPNCRSIDVHEFYGIYRTGYESHNPDKPPVEKKYKLLRCRDCGRDFDEREINNR
jgi:hypothetical protein